MMLRRLTVTATALAAAVAMVLVTPGSSSADPATAGTYNSVNPTRVLDTRSGIGGSSVPIASGATLDVDITEGLAGPVGAVALTITAVTPQSPGWIVVSPGGVPRPLASTVSFVAGRTTVNTAIVPVSADGVVSVYNGSAGSVNVVADLTGWWTGGEVSTDTAGAVNTLSPTRILDTRTGTGGPVQSQSSTIVPILGRGGVPETGVSAVALNLTVVRPQASGYVTASAELEQPGARTSSLNFQAGQTRANLAIVPVNPDGSVTLFNGSSGRLDYIVDIAGYVSDGPPVADGAFLPSTSFRVADTRVVGGPIPSLATRKMAVFPDDGTAFIFKAVAVNITVISPRSSGFLTAWDGVETTPPTTSNNHFATGENGATETIVPVNPDGTISFYNGSAGSFDLAIDVTGFVLNDLTTTQARAAVARAHLTGASNDRIVREAIAGVHRVAIH